MSLERCNPAAATADPFLQAAVLRALTLQAHLTSFGGHEHRTALGTRPILPFHRLPGHDKVNDVKPRRDAGQDPQRIERFGCASEDHDLFGLNSVPAVERRKGGVVAAMLGLSLTQVFRATESVELGRCFSKMRDTPAPIPPRLTAHGV